MTHRFLPRVRSVAIVALLAIGTGCDQPLDVSVPLLQTDGEVFELRRSERGFDAVIPYGFENRTGSPVYIVNCLGSFSLALDRWDDGEWTPAWSPVLPGCLSSSIVIGEGEVFSDTLFVWGALPEENAVPRFDTAEPGGRYRIRWLSAYRSLDEGQASGTSIPEEFRVSNSFQLEVP